MSDTHQHAKRYAPSASHRWTVCHASARFNEHFTSESSAWALDGTEAHSLFAFAINSKLRLALEAKLIYPGAWVHREDTEEQRLDSVQTALDYVWSLLDAHPDAVVFVETRVDFLSPHTTDCWGHADIILWMPALGVVEIIDLKHGAGEVVEAENNTQLGIYGAASYQFAKERLGAKPHTIVMTIVQPRAWHALGPVRHWPVSDAYMDNLFIPFINANIAKCEDPNAAFVPGKKQCKWCPGAFECKAREAAALAAVPAQLGSFQNVTKAALPPISAMTIERLLWITQAGQLLRDYIKEAEEALEKAALAGHRIPGKKLVEAWATRKWFGNHLDVARELMKLLDTNDWDVVYPRELINITDAESKIAKKFSAAAPKGKKKEAATLAKDALAFLTLKTSSGNVSLVDESDTRPAIDASRGQFKGITIIDPPKRIGT